MTIISISIPALLLLTIITGLILQKGYGQYGKLSFAIHKLSALAAILIYYFNYSEFYHLWGNVTYFLTIQLLIIIVTAVLILSGGAMSLGKLKAAGPLTHKICTVILIICIIILFFC